MPVEEKVVLNLASPVVLNLVPPAKPEEVTPIKQTPMVAILTMESPNTVNDGLGQRVVCALGIQYLNDAGVIPDYDTNPDVFDAKEVSRHSTNESSVFDDVLRAVDLN